MAANVWEKLFDPRFSSVCTKTSIFRGLKVDSTISFSEVSRGLGKSFSSFSTSSGVHFWRIATTNLWAVAVPGSEAVRNRVVVKSQLRSFSKQQRTASTRGYSLKTENCFPTRYGTSAVNSNHSSERWLCFEKWKRVAYYPHHGPSNPCGARWWISLMWLACWWLPITRFRKVVGEKENLATFTTRSTKQHTNSAMGRHLLIITAR